VAAAAPLEIEASCRRAASWRAAAPCHPSWARGRRAARAGAGGRRAAGARARAASPGRRPSWPRPSRRSTRAVDLDSGPAPPPAPRGRPAPPWVPRARPRPPPAARGRPRPPWCPRARHARGHASRAAAHAPRWVPRARPRAVGTARPPTPAGTAASGAGKAARFGRHDPRPGRGPAPPLIQARSSAASPPRPLGRRPHVQRSTRRPPRSCRRRGAARASSRVHSRTTRHPEGDPEEVSPRRRRDCRVPRLRRPAMASSCPAGGGTTHDADSGCPADPARARRGARAASCVG